MNQLVENLTGTNIMTDQVIANDLLQSAKSGITCYAKAITEAASDDVRTVMQNHLQDAIAGHGAITKYMMNKGWYHAYNPQEQVRLDMKAAETALNLQA